MIKTEDFRPTECRPFLVQVSSCIGILSVQHTHIYYVTHHQTLGEYNWHAELNLSVLQELSTLALIFAALYLNETFNLWTETAHMTQVFCVCVTLNNVLLHVSVCDSSIRIFLFLLKLYTSFSLCH